MYTIQTKILIWLKTINWACRYRFILIWLKTILYWTFANCEILLMMMWSMRREGVRLMYMDNDQMYTYNPHLFWSSAPYYRMKLHCSQALTGVDLVGSCTVLCFVLFWGISLYLPLDAHSLFSSCSHSFGIYQTFVHLLNFQGELSCETYAESASHKLFIQATQLNSWSEKNEHGFSKTNNINTVRWKRKICKD